MVGIRIAAVMAVHNRKSLTLACLEALRGQRVQNGSLDVFVLDDASSDGTAEAVAERHPDVRLLPGDGQLYWNGGMRAAFGAAIDRDYDYYLWMNDDTELVDENILAMLLRTEQQLSERGHGPVIVAGTTQHPQTGGITYGGLVRLSRRRPLNWTLVEPGMEPRRCETMNGNVVLVSRAVTRRIGNIDPAYIQQLGDLDYGLRARASGCEVWIAPGIVGVCASHPPRRTDRQPLRRELARLWSVKELAPKPWLVFTHRWAGPLWFVYWLSPYLHRGFGLILQRVGVRSTVSGVR